MAYGLSTKMVRQLAYDMVIYNKLPVRQSWVVEEKVGLQWLHRFVHRNKQMSIWKPEACSLSRLTSFNTTNVDLFFSDLKNILENNPLLCNRSRIYNLDETGLTIVQKPQKVIATRGKNSVY